MPSPPARVARGHRQVSRADDRELTAERRDIELDRADHHLSETKPFTWRRRARRILLAVPGARSRPSGAIGFSQPDRVIVLIANSSTASRIVGTRGLMWEGTAAKEEALGSW